MAAQDLKDEDYLMKSERPRLPVELMRKIVEEAVFRYDGISSNEKRSKRLRRYLELPISNARHRNSHALCEVVACCMPMNLLLTSPMMHDLTKEAFRSQAHINLKTAFTYDESLDSQTLWDTEKSVAFLRQVRHATISIYTERAWWHPAYAGKLRATDALKQLSEWLSGSTCLQLNMLSSRIDPSVDVKSLFQPEEVDAALQSIGDKCFVRVVLMTKCTEQCEGGMGRPEHREVEKGPYISPQSCYFRNHKMLDASFRTQHNRVFEVFRAKSVGMSDQELVEMQDCWFPTCPYCTFRWRPPPA